MAARDRRREPAHRRRSPFSRCARGKGAQTGPVPRGVDRLVEAGTHCILLGAVRHVILGEHGQAPLLYAQGGYGGFSAELASLAG